jgi:hypothetical protein
MKKVHLILIILFVFSIIWILFIHPTNAIDQKKNFTTINSIPGDVTVVLRRSCIKCHDTAGNKIAMAVWSFSKWDTLAPEMQARLAKLMCKVLSNESMPPMAVKRADPELIPTAAEIDIVCKWSNLYK